jgi:hypothetical protein
MVSFDSRETAGFPMVQIRSSWTTLSHDPLLNRFREVRGLLAKFRDALQKQHKFETDVAAAFRDADEEVWNLSQDHDRLKRSSRMTPSASEAQMERLGALLDKWRDLSDLAAAGSDISAAQIRREP